MKAYTRRTLLKSLGATALLTTGISSLVFAKGKDISKETRSLMDTLVTIEVRDSSYERRREAITSAFEAIERAIMLFDRYNANSILALLNEQGKITSPPQEFISLITLSKQLAHETKHLFNPTVQPLVDYFLQSNTFDSKKYKEARALVHTMDSVHIESSSITLEHEGMGITLDGIAKGYIIDIASIALSRHGIAHYMINAGGDIAVKGEQSEGIAWTIGIQSPYHTERVIQSVALKQGAIATSGGYERYNKDHSQYTHLINPYTGKSPHRVRSVSVIAPQAVLADALATALSVMQPRDALKYIARYPQSACYIVTENTTIRSPLWGSLT